MANVPAHDIAPSRGNAESGRDRRAVDDGEAPALLLRTGAVLPLPMINPCSGVMRERSRSRNAVQRPVPSRPFSSRDDENRMFSLRARNASACRSGLPSLQYRPEPSSGQGAGADSASRKWSRHGSNQDPGIRWCDGSLVLRSRRKLAERGG